MQLTSEAIAQYAIYGDKGKTSSQHAFDIVTLIDAYHNSFTDKEPKPTTAPTLPVGVYQTLK